MQINELRLGNWIQVDTRFSSHHAQVVSIEPGCVWVGSLDEPTYPLRAPKPIPLTPEWLEKAGFKNKGEGYFALAFPDGNILRASDKGPLMLFGGGNYGGLLMILNHVAYVHQLQNLIFAMTGKELQFKD